MKTIAFISGKGGAGKTTLAANIAVALAQRKKHVALIDLDPQNAQRLHLGMDPGEIAGLVREGISPAALFDSPFGIKFIPFGRVSAGELEDFEAELKKNPHWIADGIGSLASAGFDFVILDTPPGPTSYLQQALLAAHRAMVVVLADAASYATLPKIESLVEEFTANRPSFEGTNILINQMPTNSKLGHQVRSALYANYSKKLVPVAVYKDVRVAQALAFERPVLQYKPGCKASLNIQSVTDWLIDSLED
jgi:cellulose synthase operon protein YhjQ